DSALLCGRTRACAAVEQFPCLSIRCAVAVAVIIAIERTSAVSVTVWAVRADAAPGPENFDSIVRVAVGDGAGPSVVVIEASPAARVAHRLRRPMVRIVIYFDGARSAVVAFRTVPAGTTVGQIVVAHDKATAKLRVDVRAGGSLAIAFDRVVLNEEKFLRPVPWIIGPCAVTKIAAIVSRSADKDGRDAVAGVHVVVVEHSVCPAAHIERFVSIPVVEVAVINTHLHVRPRAVSVQTHNHTLARTHREGESGQP